MGFNSAFKGLIKGQVSLDFAEHIVTIQ